MKRLLFITYQFPPIGGSGVQRVAKFASYLPKYGWIPYVLTVENSIELFSDPSLLSSIPPEVVVNRTASPEPAYFKRLRRSPAGRAFLRFTQFPDIHARWRKLAVSQGLELIKKHNLQAIYTTDPASAHWAGYELHRITGLPWVMDLRDLWTLSFTYRPISYWHGLLDRRLEHKLFQSATHIVSVTAGYPQRIRSDYPDLPEAKFSVIRNGYDEADFHAVAPIRSERFNLVYSGVLYDFWVKPRPTGWKRLFEPIIQGDGAPEMVRSPLTLLQAVGELIKAHPELDNCVQVTFVGSFPEKYLRLIGELHLEHVVKIVGYLEHQQAIRHLCGADALFLMQAGTGSEIVVPGKLYEYLRSGNAILGLFPEGESPELIRKAQAGNVLDPQDTPGIKDQLLQWIDLWRSHRPLIDPDWDFIRQFERERQTAQLALVLDKMVE